MARWADIHSTNALIRLLHRQNAPAICWIRIGRISSAWTSFVPKLFYQKWSCAVRSNKGLSSWPTTSAVVGIGSCRKRWGSLGGAGSMPQLLFQDHRDMKRGSVGLVLRYLVDSRRILGAKTSLRPLNSEAKIWGCNYHWVQTLELVGKARIAVLYQKQSIQGSMSNISIAKSELMIT